MTPRTYLNFDGLIECLLQDTPSLTPEDQHLA